MGKMCGVVVARLPDTLYTHYGAQEKYGLPKTLDGGDLDWGFALGLRFSALGYVGIFAVVG